MSVKELIKSKIVSHADGVYRYSINGMLPSFDEWIRDKEKNLDRFDMTVESMKDGLDPSKLSYVATLNATTLRIIPYSEINSGFKVKNYIEDILVFVNGELTDKAVPLLTKCFEENPNVSVVYGNEDIAKIDGEDGNRYGKTVTGTRCNPFFKPEWSPNTFLDHFYFCNVVAIRRASLRDFDWCMEKTGAASLYNTLLRYIFENEKRLRTSVAFIDEILVHAKDYDANALSDSSAYEYAEGLLAPSLKKDLTEISVIIPSKDNPDLIDKCLNSLIENRPDGFSFEIVVVDNGSSEENKEKLEALALKYSYKYIYEKEAFNFARMINKGVKESSKDILLLLNDDITFANKSTIKIMANAVKYSFSGAVGAKLLYPETTMIQHAGVFNNRIGPVHKLQFLDDNQDLYYGFNKTVNNVTGVTAAITMVRRDVFNKVKGMNEDLKVAFNDVDFCFKINEAGYVNVVCNNTFLYHAESVTRGKDTSVEKLNRLNEEKDLLYKLHPAFVNYDPFYSKYLLSDCLDSRIVAANEYEVKRAMEFAGPCKKVDLSNSRLDACVQVSMEYAGELANFLYEDGDEAFLCAQGFSYVQGSDNALYDHSLLLINEETKEARSLNFKGCYRNDVAIASPDQVNVERSGFLIKIKKSMLKPGTYRVGVLHKNKYFRESLYQLSNKYMVVN